MTTLYDRLASSESGARALAAARLRYRVLGALHEGLERSGLSQAEVAKKLGLRRSAANQVFRGSGNLRVNTVAEYLDAMGCELSVQVVPAGSARTAAGSWKTLAPRPAVRVQNSSLEWALLGADLDQLHASTVARSIPEPRPVPTRDAFQIAA